ncbi:MAG: HAD-IA family hydrolase [Limnobacter sp.]|uniref:HAD family hydrolase n=1 Tax=Limnobacter sp. TaxID=2003368 RepID=UPI0032EBD2D3
MPLRGILFDLDGTLVDTAPDLCGTIQDMQSDRGVELTAYSDMEHLASGGARLLLKAGFGLEMHYPEFPAMRAEFLERYEARIARESAVYSGIMPMLNEIKACGAQWGIVTNKPYYLAEKLVHELGLNLGCSALIGGDTAEKPKPSPLPCLMAAGEMRLPTEQCVMIGDDERDVVAGREAGMLTVAVEYGYIASPIYQWGADAVVKTAHDLAKWLEIRM